MDNARREFTELTKQVNSKVKCCKITFGYDYTIDSNREFILKVGYNENDLTNFLESINVNYDSGFGGQELDGVIWFEDNTWAERGEYDGSEWWEHKSLPEIPKELI